MNLAAGASKKLFSESFQQKAYKLHASRRVLGSFGEHLGPPGEAEERDKRLRTSPAGIFHAFSVYFTKDSREVRKIRFATRAKTQ